jgi:hypothetical protein
VTLDSVKPWHALVAVFAAAWAWNCWGPRKNGVVSIGSEDIQTRPVPYMASSDFVQWSPVSWAGRCRNYPGAVGAGITTLIYKGPPDFADQG